LVFLLTSISKKRAVLFLPSDPVSKTTIQRCDSDKKAHRKLFYDNEDKAINAARLCAAPIDLMVPVLNL
jgi:hypothetical protein